MRYGLQTHDLYHLPLGFRPSADGWKESVIAETEGWVAYDAIADPELARRMLELMRTDSSLQTPEATIVFRPTGELPEEVESARPMGAEQSNSSLVLDERYALKFYRRIAPGMNPELEVLRFLTERGFEHTPALEGYIAYEGRPLEATLATVQEFVSARGDGWELTRDTLVRGEPDWLPEHARRLGEVTALLHNALASDPSDPHFAPEDPSNEALGLLSASIDEEIEHVFTSLPDIPALEQVRGRGEEVRDHLRLLTNIGHVGRVIRTHGDYHLGQALWTDEDDWLLLDFEGEPARSVPERRRKTSPLRDVAGMLRSFAYAASAAKIRRNVDPPEGWEDRCRAEFLDGYLDTADPALLPSSRDQVERLLTVFELEKAVYELRYELHNRPDWVAIPVAGILRMLEQLTSSPRSGGAGLPALERDGARPPSRRRGTPRADLRAPRRPRHRRGGLVRGLGAERARRLGRRRLEPLGRARAAARAAGLVRDLGRARARGLRGRRVQVRGARRRRAAAPEGRPVRLPCRDPAEDGLADLPLALRVGRRRLARAAPELRPAEGADLDLRGARRARGGWGSAGRSSPSSSSPTPAISASRTSSSCR